MSSLSCDASLLHSSWYGTFASSKLTIVGHHYEHESDLWMFQTGLDFLLCTTCFHADVYSLHGLLCHSFLYSLRMHMLIVYKPSLWNCAHKGVLSVVAVLPETSVFQGFSFKESQRQNHASNCAFISCKNV